MKNFKYYFYNQDLKKPFLVSKSGQGKSQFIKDFCKSENKTLAIINGSCLEAQDFIGLPYKDENNIVRYAMPYFLTCDVVFIDEIDRIIDESIKNTLLSLFIDKKIGEHVFNGYFVTAGNAEHDESTLQFSIAMNERLQRLNFSHSTQEKINYLTSKYNNESNLFLKYCTANYKIFDELSTRTIEYYCQLFNASSEALSEILPIELKRHFENFIEGLTLSLNELIELDAFSVQKRISELKSISKVSLSLDVASNLEYIASLDSEKIKKVNYFINSCEAEIKSNYFLTLKNKALTDIKFQDLAKKLNDLGFFKDQSDYLKELQK